MTRKYLLLSSLHNIQMIFICALFVGALIILELDRSNLAEEHFENMPCSWDYR